MHPKTLSIALAVVLAGLLPSPAGAAWPDRPGPIVYAGLEPAPKESTVDFLPAGLHSFVPGVSGSAKQLTADPSDRSPQVSPDGRLVVFSRTVRTAEYGREVSGIFVIGIDGTGLRQLTDGGPGDAGDVKPIGLNGTGLRLVASTRGGASAPAVSPNGRQIAFICTEYTPEGFAPGDDHICSVRPDGSRLRNLTRDFDEEVFDPEFSPSGRLIAFTAHPGVAADIYTMRADGSRRRVLTNRGPRGRRRLFPRDYGYNQPAFSPDGRSLVAVARDGVRPHFVRIRLADLGRPQPLGEGVLGREPVWGPAP